jgi:hypothetical protein
MMITATFPLSAVSALALFQSSQLNLFEQFLTQAVAGIDSTSITAGMQTVAYVVLLIGFLWQVYESAIHGGDVRGLGTNLIKYVVTAIVVMNYHTVFTTVNQGFVNAGNWISNASGIQNLFDNWQSDLQSQYSQIGFQQMWGLITGSLAGLLDALLILVAYLLYPIVIVIFGFFYIFYGSILYIFGPIVISLMPLGATNRLAKAYVENIFIWNTWPILYGGFGSLLSAVQMGQVGQMLNRNNFLGGLGNVEGSVLIGIASIIYSLAIAVIPFIAKRIVSGDVGSTAGALIGAAATALTAGIAATEGAVAGVAAGRASLPAGGLASGQSTAGSSAVSASTARTMAGVPGNLPAPQQRVSGAPQVSATSSATPAGTAGSPQGPVANSESSAADSTPTMGEQHAERIRTAMGKPKTTNTSSPSTGPGQPPATAAQATKQASTPTRTVSRGSSSQRPSIAPYRLSTWGAYHIARFAASSAVQGGHSAMQAAGNISGAVAHPTATAGQFGAAAGSAAGTVVNAAATAGRGVGSVAHAVTHPGEAVDTVRSGLQNVGNTAASAAKHVGSTAHQAATTARTEFSSAYEKKRDENN